MKVQTKRKLDFYLGGIFVFLLTVFSKINGIFHQKKEEYDNIIVRKALFIKFLGMGSVILTMPAIRYFKDEHPEAAVYYLTFSENKETVALCGLVKRDNILEIKSDSMISLIRSWYRFFLVARKERFDVVVDYEFFSKFSMAVSFLTGAKLRVGFFGFGNLFLYRGDLLTRKIPFNHMKHVSQNFLSMVYSLSYNKEMGDTFCKYPAWNIGNIRDIVFMDSIHLFKKEVEEKIKFLAGVSDEKTDIVVISPAVSDIGKELRLWGRDRFALLAENILCEYKKSIVVFVGTKKDRPDVENIINKTCSCRDRSVNFAGMSTVGELLALFSISRVVITLDSGPMHIASLTDKPIVSLFSTETPCFFGPLSDKNTSIYLDLSCQPCLSIYNGKTPFCRNNKCMKGITVDHVWKIVDDLLKKAER